METTETQQLPEPEKRLRRTPDDKIVAGVCGGLGRYFGIDPVFFRIGAVALAFVGGAGILLYLAALLLMPNEAGEATVTTTGEGRNRALVIAGVVVLLLIAWPFLLGGGLLLAGVGIPLALVVGAGVLVWWLVSGEGPSGEPGEVARRAALGVGIIVLCCLVLFAGALAAAAGPDWLVPAMVIASAVVIVAGAFLKPVRWLVPPALTLALAGGAVAAAGIDLDGGVGDRDYRPSSAMDIANTYELGIGELIIDLRETDLPAGDVPLRIDLGVGDARVIVPEDVCVATSADIGIGHVDVLGQENGGIDVDYRDTPDAAPGTTRLMLDAEIGLGQVRVDHDWLGFEDDGNAACEPTGARASG